MKPIHHALVSHRLFGGAPEDYVSLHNHFDLSKAALPDMRHRAALHSCDHGRQVMEMVFRNRSFPGATLDQLCRQHVEDDQGFEANLDDWLSACEAPRFVRIRRRPSPGLAAFLDDPLLACTERWGGDIEDYRDICAYYALPEGVSDHPLAPAVSRNAFGIYFSEAIFGPAITITRNDGRPKYVPVRDIGECLTLARFGRIPTLGDVFQSMSQERWMLGSRVSDSRHRRCESAGMSNLFSTELECDEPGTPSGHRLSELKVRTILAD